MVYIENKNNLTEDHYPSGTCEAKRSGWPTQVVRHNREAQREYCNRGQERHDFQEIVNSK